MERICVTCNECGYCDANQELASAIVGVIRKYDGVVKEQLSAQEYRDSIVESLKRV